MVSQVICPEPDRLFDLLEGTLPPDQRDTLSRHLDHCALCQQTLESLASGGQPLPQSAPEPAHHSAYESALQKVMERLENQTVDRETPATNEQKDQELPFDFLSPSETPGHLGKLGHYDVTEMIGRGGMGIVLKAFDEKLHRVVAIKVMAPELASNATARKRFVREAQAAAAVRDEHVIDIHAVEDAGPLPYLVMEYVLGKSLQERLDETGPLEVKEILRIGHQIACGLAAAHAQNLIHRDIKPANILIADCRLQIADSPEPIQSPIRNPQSAIKITDFGLARAVDDASISQSGIVAGTPQYMAPEQARGEPVDHRSDLFSLGSVLYAMCTGRAPFRAHNTVAVLRRVSDDQTRPIREINPEIPDWLVSIVDKLHAKEPDQRFQSAAEVAELLAERLADLQHPSRVTVPTPPVSPPSKGGEEKVSSREGERVATSPLTKGGIRGGRRRWALAAALLLLLALAPVGYQYGPAVYRFATDQGQLVIETEDPDIEVTVKRNGEVIKIVDAKTGKEITLKAGKYQVELTKGKQGLKLSSGEFTLERGGKEIVKVKLEPDVAVKPAGEEKVGEIRRFKGHAAGVQSVAISSDGWRILSGSDDKTVRLWDFNTGQELRRFEGHNDKVYSVAFSPLDRRIISGSLDMTVRLWDSETGKELRRFVGHTDCVACVAISPDARRIISGGNDKKLRLWDVESGKELRRFEGHTREIYSVAISPDGRRALSGSWDETMRLWDLETGQELRRFEGHTDVVKCVTFSPDGRRALSAGAADKTVRLWDVETGKELRRFEGHRGFAHSVAFSPDGLRAVSGGTQAVYLWDLQSGRLLQSFAGHTGEVACVAFAPSGQHAVSADWYGDNNLRLWQLPVDLAQKAAQPASGAFVVLGGKGVAERKFDTLAEAVQGSSDGDTIEIRGNGPFVTEPITLKKALTMRAGERFHPTLQLDARRAGPLLTTEGSLVLEGIEFLHQPGNDAPVKPWSPTLSASGAVLQVANCRFVRKVNVPGPCVHCDRITRAEFRNSQFTRLGGTPGNGISYRCPPMGTLLVENCADSASYPLTLNVDATKGQRATIRLRNNTWVARHGIQLILSGISGPIPESHPADAPLVTMESAQNVFDLRNLFMQVNDSELIAAPPPKETLTDACRRFLAWRDEGSLYPSQVLLGVEATKGNHIVVDGQAAWDRFWNLQPTAARSGTPKFQGGDVYALCLTGAQALGPDDFRLRADSAGYRAGTDGKDLGADVDLVGPGAAYERWKQTPEYQQWLKDTGQLRAEAPQPEPQAFVVLGGKGVAERKFDTLAEAVQNASDGDTIEIRGNGPFVSPGLVVRDKALCIRAGEGFHPVIQLNEEGTKSGAPLFLAHGFLGSLALEGLEIHGANYTRADGGVWWLIRCDDAALHVTNCRFLRPVGDKGRLIFLYAKRCPFLQVRNCQFSNPPGDAPISWLPHAGEKGIVKNCLIACEYAVELPYGHPARGSLSLENNTLATDRNVIVRLYKGPPLGTPADKDKLLHLEARENILGGDINFWEHKDSLENKEPMSPLQAENLLQRLILWKEARNLYGIAPGKPFLTLTGQNGAFKKTTRPYSTLAEWQDFWGLEALDSLQALPVFQGGNLLGRARQNPEKLVPEDFRLASGSPGKGAGPDGKDLGADVDLVGPGAAYERWKKTPEYQQWLKDTGQLRAEVPKPEPKAFVVLGGQGVAERKFDTLAEAVRQAADGDTIEVRGNALFLTEPVNIGKQALTIRAGEGFRPVIKFSSKPGDLGGHLASEGLLVLEGLELHAHDAPRCYTLYSNTARVLVANCRFVGQPACDQYSRMVCFRNCEFLSRDQGYCLQWCSPPEGKCHLHNCVSTGGVIIGIGAGYEPKEVSIHLTRNTFVTPGASVLLAPDQAAHLPKADAARQKKPFRLVTEGNVLDARSSVFLFDRSTEDEKPPPLQPQEVEAALLGFCEWTGRNNLYGVGTTFSTWGSGRAYGGHKTLADWNRFWGNSDTGSIEGRPLFQGGNILAKRAAAPEQLTPNDFRLRPDSPGYKAGKDGKDLGADVDLVGPGAAYERWKKTPEYQQWLKDTGQLREGKP